MNSRLQQFLTAENISQAEFADKIKVARAGVSHIVAGRNNPSFDFMKNMLDAYPNLNIEWFMTGKGKMYKSHTPVRLESLPDGTARMESDPAPSLFDQNEPDSGQISEQPGVDGSSQPILPKESFQKQEELQDTGTRSGEVRRQELQEEAGTVERTHKIQRKAVKIIVFYDDNTFQEF